MDHIAFLAQERAELVQRKFYAASSSAVRSFASLKDGTKVFMGTLVGKIRDHVLFQRMHAAAENLRDLFMSIRVVGIYDSCVHYLLTEVTRTHVYFGGMCFIFGALIGIGMGTRLKENVLAPQLMRAVVANTYSGLESISLLEDIIAPKVVAIDQVLIQVKAAGIDYVDVKISKGYAHNMRNQINKYNPNYCGEFPVILGRDCAGVVVAIGRAVEKFHVGDEVWACVPVYHQGTQSEFIVTSEEFVSCKPSQLSFEGAASMPYDIMRAWDALVVQAGLGELSTAGKRVLIHAGVTGVGCIAVQLIRAWGGHVTTTVNSVAEPLVHMLGADDVITYDTTNFEKELRMRERFDVVLNPLGSALPDSCLIDLCKEGGVVVTATHPTFASDTYGCVLGFMYAIFCRLKFMFGKPPWLSGTRLGNIRISGEVLNQVAPIVLSGQLQPVVEKAYSAQDAEIAYAQMMRPHEPIGKSILRFRSRSIPSSYQLNDL